MRKERIVEHITYGTGPQLTTEEIERANALYCRACGFIHPKTKPCPRTSFGFKNDTRRNPKSTE